MAEPIARRRFLQQATAGLAAAAALSVISARAADSGSVSVATITEADFGRLSPSGFRVTAVMDASGRLSQLGSPVALTMRQQQATNAARSSDGRDPALRQPFSVSFSSDSTSQTELPDGLYRLSHPSWPSPPLLSLTRIGPSGSSPVYEAVFG